MYKIECFHTLGTPESERLKVAALNLFHPTASPPFQKVGFFILRHSLYVKGRLSTQYPDEPRNYISFQENMK
ncbi:MAG: hypothetical protein A2V86_12210 [Deltaproteobacteria bacterium RBG_16_49_23]|nr:MAG: hypothetical protein A2V86_12210 [Deltaproteobacteria bacterium RBG_16_49_23]